MPMPCTQTSARKRPHTCLPRLVEDVVLLSLLQQEVYDCLEAVDQVDIITPARHVLITGLESVCEGGAAMVMKQQHQSQM